jgi:predicted dehydrogenase
MVGCGAIVELGHLPAASRIPDCEVRLLIDRDRKRIEELSLKYGVSSISNEISNVSGYADAAIVAVPHHLHAPIAIELMSSGVHVLLEKPMALSVTECDKMIAVAVANNVNLTIGMPRRFCSSNIFLKQALESKILGDINSYSIESGIAATWPSKSLYLLNVEQSGGGVLMANGCHDLDLASWLFGEILDIHCSLDSKNRLDANCRMVLSMDSGAKGVIELSRIRNLSNKIRINGDRGILEAPLLGLRAKMELYGQPQVSLSGVTKGSSSEHEGDPFQAAMDNQLIDFIGAIRGESSKAANGATGRDIVRWIDNCYSNAKLMSFPWEQQIKLLTS